MDQIQQKMIKGPAQIAGIHSSGRCIAIHDEKKHYLDFGIPGEEVTFISHRKKQGFRSGEVVEILNPSPHRVKPFCPHFRECGGCPWQHMKYSYQLELKRQILVNALEKYQIHTPVVPQVIPSPWQENYRHRVEYTFSKYNHSDVAVPDSVNALGFHRNGEPGKVIDISNCWLQAPPSRMICDFVKSYALDNDLEFYDHQLKTGFLRSLSVRLNKAGEALVIVGLAEDRPAVRNNLLKALTGKFGSKLLSGWTVHLSPTHSQLQGLIQPYGDHNLFFYENACNLRFRMHASSFFQPNAGQAEKIFETIREWADLTGTEKVYDLYTGIGTIALFLAPKAGHVTGIEGSDLAIEDARYNAHINGIENVKFITGDILGTFKPGFLSDYGKPDLIVLDPPRPGTLIEIKKTINGSGAKKIIYLSCNPVSLAFDLKQLTEVYHVSRIQPFDMLPHTHHLETLVLLEL
jgi:23S rRNA (uracil1939-C5)-methyltransferase